MTCMWAFWNCHAPPYFFFEIEIEFYGTTIEVWSNPDIDNPFWSQSCILSITFKTKIGECTGHFSKLHLSDKVQRYVFHDTRSLATTHMYNSCPNSDYLKSSSGWEVLLNTNFLIVFSNNKRGKPPTWLPHGELEEQTTTQWATQEANRHITLPSPKSWNWRVSNVERALNRPPGHHTGDS